MTSIEARELIGDVAHRAGTQARAAAPSTRSLVRSGSRSMRVGSWASGPSTRTPDGVATPLQPRTIPRAAMSRATEAQSMQETTPITCLFLDIGGVLLTNGWDHRCPPSGGDDVQAGAWPRWRSGIT